LIRALLHPRRRLLIPAGVLVLALGTVGFASAQTPIGTRRPTSETQIKPLRELGSQLYAANCSTCHGIAGRGVTERTPNRGVGKVQGLGPSLRGVGAGTVDFYLRTGYMPLTEPDKQPQRHSPPEFSDHEIRALIAYVTSLGDIPGPPIPHPHPEEGSLSQGFHIFSEYCAGCHQVAAQGGLATGARIPPLEDDPPVRVAEAVRTGPYLMPKFQRS
jgi:ubiquinol-cytochrome c reductase cytochrome c subunit